MNPHKMPHARPCLMLTDIVVPSPLALKAMKLFPAVHRFAMQRIGRDLDELHAVAVWIGDVGEDGLGGADVYRGDSGAALFEHRVRLILVVDDDTEVADAGRAAVCGL